MIQEGYTFKNSIIHKMNPSIKMVTSILFIILIFLPFGFLSQVILFTILIFLFFLSKLPFKKLLKIFISIIFMAIILGIINWVSYKTPGVIFDLESKFNILELPYWINNSNKNLIQLNGKWFAHGDIWGGSIINNLILDQFFVGNNGSLSASGNGFYIINGLNYDQFYNLQNELTNQFPNYIIEFQENKLSNGSYEFFLFCYSSEWYAISSFSIGLMIYVTIKIFLIILIISILTSTTSPIELTYGIEDLLNPLKYLKAPISEWSMIIALSIRFIPSLLDESNRVLKAQASRGVDFKNGNTIDKMKSLASLVVPLFSIAFMKAEELSNAMEARAYNPRNLRTRYRVFPIRLFDWFFLGFLLFYFGLIFMLCFFNGKPLLFTPFGILDAIMILS